MFGDRHGDAVDIDFLEGIFAQKRQCHVAGDGNDRNTVHIGSRNTGDKIGGTRPAGRHADTDFSGRTGVAVRCVGGTLLMGSQIVIDLISVFVKCIIYIQDRTARITKNGIHTLLEQALDDDIRTC